MRRFSKSCLPALLFALLTAPSAQGQVVRPEQFRQFLGDSYDWARKEIPFLDCPDPQIEEIYYFRWIVFRKHIKQTPVGFIITEFLPDVPWAGKYNSISCAAGQHFYEGRWLRRSQYLDDYALFWFRKGGNPRLYSFWAADALYRRFEVDYDKSFIVSLLPDLIENYRAWEESNQDPNGLFWQIDDRDGMEYSIGGSGYRPTINSYMYGDAVAISRIAALAQRPTLAREFGEKAQILRKLVLEKLWDPEAKFFKTLARDEVQKKELDLVDVREEIGFIPWYFLLPEGGSAVAWLQLMDPEGFYAPFGPTTAERRHPRFMLEHPHDCLWNGPSWPYATTQTLVALANLLNSYDQRVLDKSDYFQILKNYTKSQYKDGHPWIAEDLNGITGEWIVDKPRSAYYNHSGYNDLIISGLIGLRPSAEDKIELNPLVPATWDYFCLEPVQYHGRSVSIFYDKDGSRYQRGKGLRVLVDGKEVGAAATLQKLTVPLASADE